VHSHGNYVKLCRLSTVCEVGMCCCVMGLVVASILRDTSAFIVRQFFFLLLDPKNSHYCPSKHHKLLPQWCCITSRNTWIFSSTAVRTLNFAQIYSASKHCCTGRLLASLDSPYEVGQTCVIQKFCTKQMGMPVWSVCAVFQKPPILIFCNPEVVWWWSNIVMFPGHCVISVYCPVTVPCPCHCSSCLPCSVPEDKNRASL
jgi:hypothetical protein